MIRASVRFRGRVQGVGFRYSTNNLAKHFEVSGMVRNELDGSVFMQAEGTKGEVAAFINAIREQMADFIHEDTVVWSEATQKWDRFAIE